MNLIKYILAFSIFTFAWAFYHTPIALFAKVNDTFIPIFGREYYHTNLLIYTNPPEKPTQVSFENNVISIGTPETSMNVGFFDSFLSYSKSVPEVKYSVARDGQILEPVLYSCDSDDGSYSLITLTSESSLCSKASIYLMAYDTKTLCPAMKDYMWSQINQDDPTRAQTELFTSKGTPVESSYKYAFYLKANNTWTELTFDTDILNSQNSSIFVPKKPGDSSTVFSFREGYVFASNDHYSGYAGFIRSFLTFHSPTIRTLFNISSSGKILNDRTYICEHEELGHSFITTHNFGDGVCPEVEIYLLRYNRTVWRPVEGIIDLTEPQDSSCLKNEKSSSENRKRSLANEERSLVNEKRFLANIKRSLANAESSSPNQKRSLSEEENSSPKTEKSQPKEEDGWFKSTLKSMLRIKKYSASGIASNAGAHGCSSFYSC